MHQPRSVLTFTGTALMRDERVLFFKSKILQMKNIFHWAGMLCCICGLCFCSAISAQIVPDSQLKVKVDGIQNPGERLMQLEPALFAYSTDRAKQLKLPSNAQYGFLTEHFEQIFPELVNERSVSHMFGKNSFRNVRMKTVDHSGLVPVLVATVKEQQMAISEMRRELDALKKKLDMITRTQ